MTPEARRRRWGRIVALVGCVLTVLWLAEAVLTREPITPYHVLLAATGIALVALLLVQRRQQP